MKTISRYIMTLALLLTAVGGAWAEEKSETISTTTSQEVYTGEHFKITTNKQYDMLTVADLRRYLGGQVFFFIETLDGQNISKLDLQINYIDDTSIDNLSLSSGTKSYDSNTKVLTITNVNADYVQITLTEGDEYGVVRISSVTYYYEESPAGPEVTPGSSANTWTFAMPAFDVVLTPIYAKAAAFATTGTEPEVKTLLPEAAEGVIAGTDASLIAEGTGIVAFAGTSTEVTQGTLMYAIGTSATEAPALTAFSATVPTAENVADDGADVYVWYYIQGADTPDGQQATEENTFNDTEPACLTVTVLTNKFDIQFNAANANTIEAGKATVTVGGTAATVTEGKLEGVKMGSEVKVKANTGYKFRKVEVKKKEAEALPALNITNPAVGQVIGSDGKNYAYGSLPTGVTAVAKICYVSGSNGLALALTDDGYMDWSTAMTTCAAHTPAFSNGTWKLASKDEWENMISAAGSYTALRNGFSSVGGTNLKTNYLYWSSTEDEEESVSAWGCNFSSGGGWADDKGNYYYFRACLAF